MYTEAIFLISQFPDSLATPVIRPKTEASTIPVTATLIVFSNPTRKAFA